MISAKMQVCTCHNADPQRESALLDRISGNFSEMCEPGSESWVVKGVPR